MNWLVNAIALALAVGDATQACTRQKTDATRDDTGFVGNDVAQQAAGNDNTVKAAMVLHQIIADESM
jgi:hypothetical protein